MTYGNNPEPMDIKKLNDRQDMELATKKLISELKKQEYWQNPKVREAFEEHRKSEFGLWGQPLGQDIQLPCQHAQYRDIYGIPLTGAIGYDYSQYSFEVLANAFYIERRNTK